MIRVTAPSYELAEQHFYYLELYLGNDLKIRHTTATPNYVFWFSSVLPAKVWCEILDQMLSSSQMIKSVSHLASYYENCSEETYQGLFWSTDTPADGSPLQSTL